MGSARRTLRGFLWGFVKYVDARLSMYVIRGVGLYHTDIGTLSTHHFPPLHDSPSSKCPQLCLFALVLLISIQFNVLLPWRVLSRRRYCLYRETMLGGQL